MFTMPFGKHKNELISAVPTPYLQWLTKTVKLSRSLLVAVVQELQTRGVSAPAPDQPIAAPTCGRCGTATIRYRWIQDRLGRRQIRRECARCGNWMGFAPQVEPYTTEADAEAGQTPILDVVIRLEELGVTLQSDGRRAWVGADDWGRVPPDLHALIRQCAHTLASMVGARQK